MRLAGSFLLRSSLNVASAMHKMQAFWFLESSEKLPKRSRHSQRRGVACMSQRAHGLRRWRTFTVTFRVDGYRTAIATRSEGSDDIRDLKALY